MSDAPEWGPDDLPLVFRRDPPHGLEALLVVCLASLAAVLVGGGTVLLLEPGLAPLGLAELPVGRTAVGGTLGGLGLLLLLYLMHFREARALRRYGCCHVLPDGLRVSTGTRSPNRFVPHQQLDQREVTPWGLWLTVHPSRSGSPSPGVLIPTRDEDESARVLRLLDRLQLAAGEAPVPVLVHAGDRRLARWLLVPTFAPVVGLVLLWVAGVERVRFRPEGLPLILCMVLMGGMAVTLAVSPWIGDLRLTSRAVHAGGLRLAWDELRVLACDGEHLALEVSRTRWALVRLTDRGQALRAAMERLGVTRALDPQLPAWAAPGARRVRAGVLLAAWVGCQVTILLAALD